MASVVMDAKGAGGAAAVAVDDGVGVVAGDASAERVAAADSVDHAEGDADSEERAVCVEACVMTLAVARKVPEL